MTGYAHSRQEAADEIAAQKLQEWLTAKFGDDDLAYIAMVYLRGLEEELDAGLPGVRDEGLDLGIETALE